MMCINVINAQEVKYLTGVPTISYKECKEMTQEMKQTLELSSKRGDVELPKYVNNATTKYFPNIIFQVGASCAQASGIGYMYNYELNYLLDRDGKSDENICPYLFIWNFLNSGNSFNGSFPWDGWKIVNENGVPYKNEYDPTTSVEWMTGFDKYHSGMVKRVAESVELDLFPNGFKQPYDVEVMNQVKRWLFDRGDGSSVGGLVNFMAFADPLTASLYDGPGSDKCAAIIPIFGTSGQHSMAIVGYNDEVWYDYNGNDVKDEYEMGAFLVANTWGEDWGDKGFYYAPYFTFLKLMQGQGGTGNGPKSFYIVKAKVEELPKYVVKLVMTHTSRNDISLILGGSYDHDAQFPETTIKYSILQNQGGDKPLTGRGGEKYKVFEIGLDATKLLNAFDNSMDVKYFIGLDSKKDKSNGKGEVIYCSLIDYSKGQDKPTEYVCNVDSPLIKPSEAIFLSTIPSKARTFDGANTYVNYTVDEAKKLSIFFDAKDDTYVEVDILTTSGELYKNIVSNGYRKGVNYVYFDLNSISLTDFILRISTDSQVIYKNINL